MINTVQMKTEQGAPRIKPVGLAVLSVLSAFQASAAASEKPNAPMTVAQVEFDREFFSPGSGATLNLSRFEKGNVVVPGTYNVDLYVNSFWAGRVDVPFKTPNEQSDASAQACFDKALLMRIGVDLAKLAPETSAKLAEADACLPIGQIVDHATSTFDFGEQRLDLSIQQASLKRDPRGYVSPEFWDDGVNAGFVGYDANVYTYKSQGGGTQTQGYFGVNGGVNLGAWHFRHDGSYNWDSTGGQHYENIATYVQRDLPKLTSQLTIGEAYTSGDLFDSTAFRGVRIATDDRMLPDSLRGYAPIVRGVANSNAKVTIKQGGVVIYDTTVAPGAFEINDLYPTGYGGDLKVEVTEADGSVHSFEVPYAAVPMSLRPGVSRYSFTAGTVRDPQLSGNPFFMQATWQRGVTNALTGYGGVTIAQGYGAAIAGGVLNTRFGAVGVDYTQAITWVPGKGRMSGGSARISYSKNIEETGSNIAIAAYRYSTGGYLDLSGAMQVRDVRDGTPGSFDSIVRPRNRAQVTFGQSLGTSRGYVSVTASTTNYWNRSGSDVNYSVGYSNSFRNLSYSLQATRQRASTGGTSTLYYASVTIPLGRTYPVTVNSSVSRDSNGRTQVQSMLSGSLGADRNLSYGVTLNHAAGNGSSGTSGSANALYHGSMGDFSATASTGSGYWQGSAGMRGGIVAHPGGITLSQPVSETFGIVEAKGAAGARVLNSSGTKLDSRGYAVVPYLTAYNMNTIDLDPKGLSTDVELKVTSQQIAPRAGAIALLKFETETGRSAVVYAKRANGTPLPFGASVIDEHGSHVGVVGQASKAFVRGLQDAGELTVSWGDGPGSQCRLKYDLPVRDPRAKLDSYERIDAVCRPDGAASLATSTEAGKRDVSGTPSP